jgi:hypothetical protein
MRWEEVKAGVLLRRDGRCRISGLGIGFACVLLTVSAAVGYAGDSYSDTELVAAALEVYNEFSNTPLPYLDSAQLERLSAHKIVRVRKKVPSESSEKGHREEVVGFRLIEAPRDRVWLAALDPDFEGSKLLTEVRLEQSDRGSSLWFQHIALPWPVSDRYWVIRIHKQLDLASETKGFVWQHSWDLAEDGAEIARRTVAEGHAEDLSVKSLDNAVYTPVNQGGWILFSLEVGRTLLAYRVSADVGGSIPESWIATFAMAQLDGLLQKVVQHTQTAWKEYDPSRYVIYDGNGLPMARPVE